MKEITEVEWLTWLKTSKEIRPRSIQFSSMCGPHEFLTIIEKDGAVYELTDGFTYTVGGLETWFSIKESYKISNQEGDGI